MSDHHEQTSEITATYKKLAAILDGQTIEDCQDLTVSLLASVIVSHYRQLGMPLSFALECADAAIADVKANIRRNWNRP